MDHHQLALEKLHELKQEKRWQKDRVKNHYQMLSSILRTYIEGRFDVPALERTTTEIEPDLDLPQGNKTKLLQALKQSDLAKYAKWIPPTDQTMRILKDSIDFVTHTKPKEEETSDHKKQNR